MVKLLSLHQIRNYEDSNASNISDLSKLFIRGSKLINNDYLRCAYDSNNLNSNILWETITWKERYFHIRSMRGHPNEPRILMVLHRVPAVVLPPLSSAKGSGNPFKIFYLQMTTTIYFKRDSICWQDIATSISSCSILFKFYLNFYSTSDSEVCCVESISSDNTCILTLEVGICGSFSSRFKY